MTQRTGQTSELPLPPEKWQKSSKGQTSAIGSTLDSFGDSEMMSAVGPVGNGAGRRAGQPYAELLRHWTRCLAYSLGTETFGGKGTSRRMMGSTIFSEGILRG